MVWSLVLCPDNAKQDPVVYGAEFGVVFLARSVNVLPSYSTASIASAYTFRVLRESATFASSKSSLTKVPLNAHPACAGWPGNFNAHVLTAPVCRLARPLRLAPFIGGLRGGSTHMFTVFSADTSKVEARQTSTVYILHSTHSYNYLSKIFSKLGKNSPKFPKQIDVSITETLYMMSSKYVI